jgi:pimeloyl-ACP methyl ester carboxylesterase
MPKVKYARAGVLDVAYRESGSSGRTPIVLLHGFPYDVHAYDAVTALLAGDDVRVLAPYLRGYGPTRFVSPHTLRSGEQAALASDLLAFMDALEIERAVLGGYDWGGRAACIVAALHPERVLGLVTGGGYNLQNIPASVNPAAPEIEATLWYQYYFHGERGRAALMERRHELCRYLWRTWSPTWRFDDVTFLQSAASLDSPDFVDVVVHSYRHRFALVAGDAAYLAMERALEKQPRISVPTISLEGLDSGFRSGAAERNAPSRFGNAFETRELAGVGHNIPQEAPDAFVRAILTLIA